MKIFPFATTWMDLEGIMHSEIADRERQILYDITHMCNIEKKLMNITKKRLTDMANKLEATSGKREEWRCK